MKKTLTSIIAFMVAAFAFAQDSYRVAGGTDYYNESTGSYDVQMNPDQSDLVFGTSWKNVSGFNEMTYYQEGISFFKKEFDTPLERDTKIKYKIIKNGNWKEYGGDGADREYTIPKGAKRVYFCINVTRNQTFQNTEYPADIYAFTDFVLAGDTQIAKTNEWSFNEASNILTTEDGNIFTITKHDVIASENNTTFRYKVVGKGGWAFEVPGNNGNQSLTLAERGSYDVTFTFNFSEKTLTANAVKQPTQYYIYGGHGTSFGDDWSILGKMTQNGDNWEYDYTYNSTNGENGEDTYFIAPDYVIGDKGGFTANWNALYRPGVKGTQIEGFAAGSGSTVNGDNNNWVIKGNYPNHIVFNPNTNTWSSTAYIAKAVANNEKKLGTFSAAGNVAIPEGVTAYIGKLSAGGTGIDMVEVTGGVIPANTGVLYTSTADAGANLKFCATNTATSFNTTGNVLQGTGAAGTTLADGDYVLATVSGENLAFYPVEGTPNYDPFRAYIPKDNVVGSAAKLAINFGGETGIATLSHEKTDNVYYDLQGRRVVNPTKGLFIVNGKKVIK